MAGSTDGGEHGWRGARIAYAVSALSFTIEFQVKDISIQSPCNTV